MSLFDRIDYVLDGEDAFSITEFVIWTAVILALMIPLFIFRDTITSFFSRSIRNVGRIGPKY